MWIDEGSSFRMISRSLGDIRVEMLSGSAVVASGTLPNGIKLTLLLNRSATMTDRAGAYRFDVAPARLRVLAGRATVQWSNQTFPVTAGQWLSLARLVRVRDFDKRNSDSLETWSISRAAFLKRVAGMQIEKGVQQPVTDHERVDPDSARTIFRNKQINPRTTMPVDTPTQQPRPPGCGVSPW